MMGLTTYTISLIVILVLPVLLFTGADPSMALLVRTAAACLIVLCTMAFLLGHKFYIVFFRSKDEVLKLTKQPVAGATPPPVVRLCWDVDYRSGTRRVDNVGNFLSH